MHRLLERQLRRYLGANGDVPESLKALLGAIDAAYTEFDSDRSMIERSLDLMSKELLDRNKALERELADRRRAEEALLREKEEQRRLIAKLEDAHNQLLQSEKMACIGQLAAGVAHEINNPVGYVSSNLETLGGYVDRLLEVLAAYEAADEYIQGNAELSLLISRRRKEADFDYVKADIYSALRETLEGIQRVALIVQDLRDFSHVDRNSQWQMADIHAGLNSTLNVARNEFKYKAEIIRQFSPLPEVECVPSQLNQVFLNILINAAQAIADKGTITITTGVSGDRVTIDIADTGVGIPPEIQGRIFEPFFTTKPVGKGTGLGLSLAFGIVQAHHGDITVRSNPGEGACFTIQLPVRQPRDRGAELPGARCDQPEAARARSIS